jgi:hypothetical protein
VNAVGTVKKGGPAIVTYLRGLFADANFAQGKRAATGHAAPARRSLAHRVRDVGDQTYVDHE